MLQSAKPQHDELDAACKQFAQGDLILDPLTFYVARPDITASSWAREYEFVSGGKALTLGGVAPPPEPPFLIILDQTCDVHKASIPFIHAAPVYNATSAWNPKDLQKIKSRTAFHYLYALTAPRLEQYLNHAGANDPSTSSAEGDQLWVADLRIQIPLDKGVLVGRNGISAFADPAERLFFGDVLGDRRSRPAIPSVVQDYAAPILADACASIGDLVLGV